MLKRKTDTKEAKEFWDFISETAKHVEKHFPRWKRGEESIEKKGMIIGLAGRARSGKNTIGQYLEDRYGFEQLAFADKLKELALASNPKMKVYKHFVLENGMLLDYVSDMGTDYDSDTPIDFYLIGLDILVTLIGWEKAKEVTSVREYLQNLGVGVRNTFGEDFWVNLLFEDMDRKENYVITDVRFPNEARRILDTSFRNIVLNVKRNVEKVNDHISEAGLPNDCISLTIHNTGTIEDLHNTMDWLLKNYEFAKAGR